MSRLHWIYCCLIVVVAGTSAHASGYFVDAGAGDDTNTGRSAASPFATIQRAIKAASEDAKPDMIHIASGEYIENLIIDDDRKLTLSGRSGVVVTAAVAGADVILVEAGDVTLSNLTVTGGDNGIKTNGEEISLTLRDVEVRGNADRGLSAKSIGSVTISGGCFSGNVDDGIKVGDDKNEYYVKNLDVADVTFENNGEDGLDLEKVASVSIHHTTVEGNGDDGLEVDLCGSVTVIGGVYTNNNDEGLDIDDTESIWIVQVVSTSNVEGSGLQIELGEGFELKKATIVNCEFLGNGEDGIQIVEDNGLVHSVKLTNITARDNTESGLEIVVSGKVKATHITSEDNGAADILP